MKILEYVNAADSGIDARYHALSEFVDGLGYVLLETGKGAYTVEKKTDAHIGTYLNPIPFEAGKEVVSGNWYYAEDKDLPHEAIADGVPEDFWDTRLFDYPAVKE